MDSWALVLVSNFPYIHKAFQTAHQARTVGQWKDPIILLVSRDIYENQNLQQQAELLDIELRLLPEISFENLLNIWNKNPEATEYPYVQSRYFQYMKFYCMDTYFKKWKHIFYIDSGVQIFGPLERVKQSCVPTKCLYAHSDAYPTFEWKLKRQYDLSLDNSITKNLLETYNLDCNYFQSTILIFDTDIITDTTVSELFDLMNKYPISMRNDQGIFNLYFICEKNLWKQIPICDTIGFLYDFHERTNLSRNHYLMLKYPHT